MIMDSDRLFKRIWLVNGILFLLFLIGVVGIAIMDFADDDDSGVQAAEKHEALPADLRPRAVRYDKPEKILNSPASLVQVRYGKDFGDRPNVSLSVGMSHYARSYGVHGPVVNVMFLAGGGGPGRLILDRAAYIKELTFPPEHRRYDSERVDTVPWITYAIAFADTDRNGRLDDGDAAELYLSDLDGGHFRRVLAPGLQVLATKVLPEQQLLVLALEQGSQGKDPDQLRQRAFRFNPRTNQVTADVVLDSLAANAGRILGRP
jgi:hypothetical protein